MSPRFWPFRSRGISELGSHPTFIVADGMIMSPNVANGRAIPVLILDTTSRPDVEHLVDAHELLPPGDVHSRWVTFPDAKHYVGMLLEFIRPVECKLLVPFEITRQGILVDMIQYSAACYIQPGRLGDKLSANPSAPKVLVEVTADGFMKTWDKIYHQAMAKRLHQKGLPRKEGISAAKLAIARHRETYAIRGSPSSIPGARPPSV